MNSPADISAAQRARKEQNRLAVAARRGDQNALAELLKNARFLARRLGNEMQCPSFPSEDCASIAFASFLSSLKKFNSRKADIFEFWYYKGRCAIIDEMRSQLGDRYDHKLVKQYRADLDDALNNHGRSFLDLERFAKRNGITERRARRIAVKAEYAGGAGENPELLKGEVRDAEPHPDQVIERSERIEQVRAQLGCLAPRSQAFIVAYYGLDGNPPRILRSIAAEHGLTMERVRQVIHEALQDMREQLSNSETPAIP